MGGAGWPHRRMSTPESSGESAWIPVVDGIAMRSLVEGEGTSLILYRIDPEVHLEPHSHAFPEYGTVVYGRGTLTLDGHSRSVHESDSYYIPSNLRHGLEVDPKGGPMVILHVAVSLPRSSPSFHQMIERTRAVAKRTAPPSLSRPRSAARAPRYREATPETE